MDKFLKLGTFFAVVFVFFCLLVPAEATTPDLAARSVNTFALSLYGRLCKEPGNLFFSPYSVVSAFGMTQAGARGSTAAEMTKVLGFKEDIHPSMGALIRSVDTLKSPGGAKLLESANRVWVTRDAKLKPAFKSLLSREYRSDAELLNFKGDPDGSRLTINAWVQRKTHDRIKDLLQPDNVDSSTELVLTNAVWFKADWLNTFSKNETVPLPFRVSATESQDVPTMFRYGQVRYVETDGVQVVELPYKGGLSMIVLLPRVSEGFEQMEALEKKLGGSDGLAKLEEWIQSMALSDVKMWIPKFKVEQRFSLVDTLKEMGMKLAFDRAKADFSGMLQGKRQLYIGAAIHQTFIEVDEEKTEAAAATAVAITRATAMMPQKKNKAEFRADHPFLYLIRDDHTGAILFMGRQSFSK